MTNREWLNSLTDEEFYKVLHFDCAFPMKHGCFFPRCDKTEIAKIAKYAG